MDLWSDTLEFSFLSLSTVAEYMFCRWKAQFNPLEYHLGPWRATTSRSNPSPSRIQGRKCSLPLLVSNVASIYLVMCQPLLLLNGLVKEEGAEWEWRARCATLLPSIIFSSAPPPPVLSPWSMRIWSKLGVWMYRDRCLMQPAHWVSWMGQLYLATRVYTTKFGPCLHMHGLEFQF